MLYIEYNMKFLKVLLYVLVGLVALYMLTITATYLYGKLNTRVQMPKYLNDKSYCTMDSDCMSGCGEVINKYWYEKNREYYDNNIPRESCGYVGQWLQCYENKCEQYNRIWID